MSTQNQNEIFNTKTLVQNIFAGFTVSLLALTLGAAFGILSGRGAFSGMLAAAIFALITSIFGGTRIQCSGPTAPMTTITAILVAVSSSQIVSGNPDHFINMAMFIGGIFMVLMGVFRLGKLIKYIPNVVISGFMNGIAVLIWIDQFNRLFGVNSKTVIKGDLMTNIIIVTCTTALIFILPHYIKKYTGRFSSLLSSTLLTIVLMSLVTNIFSLNIEYIQLTETLTSWQDLQNLIINQWPSNWSFDFILLTIPFALQLAILAYLDTLMTSLIVDKITKTKTKQNQELAAQGLANFTSGILGGIPGAQSTIHSVPIIKEKATMRLAGIFVGIFVLVEILLFQNLINLIPQAVFTGILFKVGYDVFDWRPLQLYVKEWITDKNTMMHDIFSRHDDKPIFVTHREFFMIVGTTLTTIFINLNAAVGIFTALFYLHNLVFMRKKPLRDLKPMKETKPILA